MSGYEYIRTYTLRSISHLATSSVIFPLALRWTYRETLNTIFILNLAMADGRRHIPLSATARARRAVAQYAAPSTPSASKAGSSRQTPVDLTDEQIPARGRKRKAGADHPSGAKSKKSAATSKEDPSSSSSSSAVARKGRGGDGRAAAAPVEKRLRRFRAQPPQSIDDIYDRATTQRFFVLGRTRTGTDECPGEVVELTGSTGNVYTVTIGLVPECDCPHAKKGNQCKHIIFVGLHSSIHDVRRVANIGWG